MHVCIMDGWMDGWRDRWMDGWSNCEKGKHRDIKEAGPIKSLNS